MLLVTIGSSILMGGVAAYAYQKKNHGGSSDHEKIRKIFNNCNLTVKENGLTKTIRLNTKRKIKGGMEYVYQLPLGLSFEEVKDIKHVLEDGVNIKKTFHFLEWDRLKRLKLDKTILQQLQQLLSSEQHRKELLLDFDGMLRVKVYNNPIPASLLWDDTFLEKCRGWEIPIGESRERFIKHDFDERPHMIVAGATGFGKSQFLKMLITSLIERHPDNANIYLIDLKGGLAFSRFKRLKQVKGFAKTPDEAKELLTAIQSGMNEKMNELEEGDFEDVKEAGDPQRNFVIIDEAADLNLKSLDIVTDISRRGRGSGFRLVYATQYPTNETLPSQVRQNIGARVCFLLETATASNAVLDGKGAEALPEIPGRAIYKRVKQQVVQCPYMTNDVIKEKVQPHVVIRARSEANEHANKEEGTRRTDTFEFEETGLS